MFFFQLRLIEEHNLYLLTNLINFDLLIKDTFSLVGTKL